MDIIANLPLWAVLLIILVAVVVFWKLIKFAIKILIALFVFLLILIGLDLIGVFSWINENIMSQLL